MKTIRGFLVGQQRALFMTRLLRTYAVMMLAVSLIALATALWALWQGESMRPDWAKAFLVAVALAPLALLLTWVTQPGLEEIARELDIHHRTSDRLLVGLTLERHLPLRPMEALAYAESLRYLADASRFQPCGSRFPREFLWLIVPATTLGLLSWSADLADRARLAERQDGPGQAAVEALLNLADEIREGWAKESEILANLPPRIEEAAKQVGNARREPAAEQQRTALGALSGLEEALRKSAAALGHARVGNDLTKTEREALRSALESVPGGTDAARALNGADRAEAGRALEQFLERADPGLMRAVGDALSREMRARGGNAVYSRESGGRSPEQLARQMIRQAAKGMLERSETGSGTADRSERAAKALREIRARIAAMKRDLREGRKPDGRPPDLFAFEAAGGARDGSPQSGHNATANAAMPSAGTLGAGAAKNLFGEKTEAAREAAATSVSGLDADGETLQAMIATAGRSAEAQRLYKNIYEAALPALREAVLREEIPEGLRLTVRRYFEAIRPRE